MTPKRNGGFKFPREELSWEKKETGRWAFEKDVRKAGDYQKEEDRMPLGESAHMALKG